MKKTVLAMAVLTLVFSAQVARAGWSANQRLTWTSTGSYSPCIAVDSKNAIHVVFYDGVPGPTAELYYKKSTDGGASWSTAQRLTWNSGESIGPTISVDSNDAVHVVWADDTPGDAQVYYKRSTDGGVTWGPAKRLTWISGWSECPAIAIDAGNTIHIAWHVYISEPFNGEIYYKKSTDGGTTWSANKRLTFNSGHSLWPAIAVGSGNAVHVVWHDDTPGYYAIFYKGSSDGGTTWTASRNLTAALSYAMYPDMTIDSNNAIHLVWEGSSSEVYYKQSSDGGATWSPSKRFTWTAGLSGQPVIALDSSQAIHVIWTDNTPGNYELYLKRSFDGGASWGAPQRLTWTQGGSYGPAMAVDSGDTIHLVWQDDTPGNMEIYYKNGK